MTPPPPSGAVARTRARAAAKGWHGPLAWDDDSIDDPESRPQLGRNVAVDYDHVKVQRRLAGDSSLKLTPLEVQEVYRILVARDHTTWEIERIYHLNSRRFKKKGSLDDDERAAC
jgi:hypothetical protein